MKNKTKVFRIASLLLVLCFISTVMISGTFAKYTSEYSGQDTALVARWKFEGNFGTDEESTNLHIWDHKYTENIYEQDGDGSYLIAPGVQGEFTVGFSYDADVDANLTFKFEKSGNRGEDNEAAAVPIQYWIKEDEDEDGNATTIYYDLDELADAIIGKAKTDSTSEITPANGGGTYTITDTATASDTATDGTGPIKVNATVCWKWPYDVAEHNDVAVAENRTDAGFTGTGDDIGSSTTFKKWTDADDTDIGLSSAGNDEELNRDSYVLELTIGAEQIQPTE
jgi:hypothetical protein